jgi:2-polyprenyl-6-methoxyphenol hydroxylase-like FAD-dependent oxidoreductase
VIADLVVVADGARSVLRERLTDDGAHRQFLNVGIVGGVFDGVVVAAAGAHARRHGMLIGDKSMCFVAEEGHGAELVSVSATFDREVSREDVRDDAAVRSRFLATLEQYSPSVVAPLVAAIERQSDSLLIVNALDRMPHAPVRGCVAFLGDASHAVSPLGGSGANMALVRRRRAGRGVSSRHQKHPQGFDQGRGAQRRGGGHRRLLRRDESPRSESWWSDSAPLPRCCTMTR